MYELLTAASVPWEWPTRAGEVWLDLRFYYAQPAAWNEHWWLLDDA